MDFRGVPIPCSTLSAHTRYFKYTFGIICGIPSVTLEGEQIDYIKILVWLDRLEEFGEEPKMWAAMLRPILRRLVSAFDGEPDVEFWQSVVHLGSIGCGTDELTGWITAFSVWTASGKWQIPKVVVPEQGSVLKNSLSESDSGLLRHLTYLDPGLSGPSYSKQFTIDGIIYPHLELVGYHGRVWGGRRPAR